MYLHEVAEDELSFTKEDMQQGKHTECERRLHEQLNNSQSQIVTSTTSVTTNTSNVTSVKLNIFNIIFFKYYKKYFEQKHNLINFFVFLIFSSIFD